MSAFYDQASLVVVPSGYKTSKVYAQKPLTTDGQLTFSRASAATRVNSAGLIEKVRTNLALYSEEFSNAYWTKTTTTITDNTAANPINGATTADTLTRTGGLSGFIRRQIAQTGVVTFSIFAKSGSTNLVRLNVYDGSTDRGATYNLTTGAITTIYGSPLFTLAQDFGSGWYRISISVNAASYSDCQVHLDSVNSVIIFGAQLETGDIATDYIATTTASVSVGPVANVPRLDYLNSSCPRLLLEPQRTNLALWSEQLDNAAINKLNTTVTANNATSPDGTQNADLIIETTTNGIHICGYDQASITSGTTYTASVFLKKTTGSPDWMQVAYSTTGLAGFANFNLTTGAVGNVISSGSAKIENYGNGWYRCSLTQTANATGTAGGPIIVFTNNTNPNQRYVSYAGSTSVSILAWGLQLEAGSYATSYIPTLGAAVTRGADAASKTGISSLIGQTEGTLFLKMNINKRSDLGGLGPNGIEISNGSTSGIYLGTAYSSSQGFGVYRNNAGSFSSLITTTNNALGTYKLAAAYSSAGFVFYVNGVQIGTSATLPPAVTYSFFGLMTFGTNTTAQGELVEQALLFKTRLTNAQLAELTTL